MYSFIVISLCAVQCLTCTVAAYCCPLHGFWRGPVHAPLTPAHVLCNPWSSFSGVLTVALISARYEEIKDNSSPEEKPPFCAHTNYKGVSI